jgi:hypothetical protein
LNDYLVEDKRKPCSMSQRRPHQHTDSDSQHSTRKHPSTDTNGLLPEFLDGLNARQRTVLQLQGQIGNAAVQRLLATLNPTIQRQDLPGLEPLHPETAEAPVPAPPTTSGGGEERLTSQEWLAKVKDPTVIVTNPMIGFSVGNTFSGFPAQVQSFDFTVGGETQ